MFASSLAIHLPVDCGGSLRAPSNRMCSTVLEQTRAPMEMTFNHYELFTVFKHNLQTLFRLRARPDLLNRELLSTDSLQTFTGSLGLSGLVRGLGDSPFKSDQNPLKQKYI